MSKQDRQGARTPADLERKYDLGKRLSDLEKGYKYLTEQLKLQEQRIRDLEARN